MDCFRVGLAIKDVVPDNQPFAISLVPGAFKIPWDVFGSLEVCLSFGNDRIRILLITESLLIRFLDTKSSEREVIIFHTHEKESFLVFGISVEPCGSKGFIVVFRNLVIFITPTTHGICIIVDHTLFIYYIELVVVELNAPSRSSSCRIRGCFDLPPSEEWAVVGDDGEFSVPQVVRVGPHGADDSKELTVKRTPFLLRRAQLFGAVRDYFLLAIDMLSKYVSDRC